jgi:hypothetical protein
MRETIELFIHFVCMLAKLLKKGGVKSVMAESMAIKQQLIVMNRGKKRTPKFTTFDRFYFGFIAFFLGENRLHKISIIIKPATILRFHKKLIDRKYSQLYSNKSKIKLGRKGPDQEIIDLVVEIKKKNPLMGYGRIAMQIFKEFGVEVSRFAVGRILRKHFENSDPGNGYGLGSQGPSWLTFIGNIKDSLWSIDLFKCELISLKIHTVMVVIDQFTRRIIGFAVYRGDCNGIAYCKMFNNIISGKTMPKYLSTDNDPLFLFHRWQANLRILDIEEIKSVPCIPQSHPFIERVIGSTRREYLDHVLFFNAQDLQRKLGQFQEYYNETRAHSSLEMKTPNQMGMVSNESKKVISLDNYCWKSYCRGLYKLPVAA